MGMDGVRAWALERYFTIGKQTMFVVNGLLGGYKPMYRAILPTLSPFLFSRHLLPSLPPSLSTRSRHQLVAVFSGGHGQSLDGRTKVLCGDAWCSLSTRPFSFLLTSPSTAVAFSPPVLPSYMPWLSRSL